MAYPDERAADPRSPHDPRAAGWTPVGGDGSGWGPAPNGPLPPYQPPYQPPQPAQFPQQHQPQYQSWPSGPGPAAPIPGPPPVPTRQVGMITVQRPAVIGISASLTITASLLWIALLVFALLIAASVRATFSYETQPDATIYHLADHFQVTMGSGLAVGLFGLPILAVVAGFLLLVPRAWARISYSVLAAVTVGWSLWWLQTSIGWWVPAAAYVALAAAICWTPGVGRWYADRKRRR